MKRILNFGDFILENEKVDNIEESAPIVIVAPHAVEADDENTKKIAELLAGNLNAFLLINDKFHKPTEKKDDTTEDFNHLPPCENGKYDWDKRVPEMKSFYSKLESLAKQASSLSKDNNKRCLVLFIHGLSHDKYDIDLGAGSKSAPNMTINAEQHTKSKDNSGSITAPIKFVETFRDVLKNEGLNVGTGDVFSAWDGQNGTQYLRSIGIDCYCVQLEINTNLRKDPTKTAELLSSAVKQLKDYSESIFYLPQEVRDQKSTI